MMQEHNTEPRPDASAIEHSEAEAKAGDAIDQAIDMLRVIHLAMSPDNSGWHTDKALSSVWSSIEQVICDLMPVRDHLQGVKGGAA